MRPRHDAVRRYRDALGHRDAVAELEALVAGAWPPLVLLDLGGWQLRSARGCGRMANSVWPRTSRPGPSLQTRIGHVERFYTARGLDSCFQIGPAPAPPHLDRLLAGRGYLPTPHVEVRAGRLDALAGRTAGAEAVTVLPEPAPRWMDAWASAGGGPPRQPHVAAAVLARVRAPSAYAVLTVGGRDVAVARGVVDGGYLGVHGLAAARPYRRPAAGGALLGALGRWALGLGAVHACVPVDGSATGLAEGAGLRRAYRYRFRVLRDPGRAPPR